MKYLGIYIGGKENKALIFMQVLTEKHDAKYRAAPYALL